MVDGEKAKEKIAENGRTKLNWSAICTLDEGEKVQDRIILQDDCDSRQESDPTIKMMDLEEI